MVRGRERQQKGLGAPVAKKSGKKPGAGKPKPKLVPAKKSAVTPKSAKPASRPSTKAVAPSKPSSKPAAKPVATKPAPVKPTPAVKAAVPTKPATPAAKPVVPTATKVSLTAKLALTPIKAAKLLKKKKLKALKARVDDTPVRLPPKPVTSDSKMQKNRAGLSAKELEHFRALLLEKRRELLGDVSSMEREALRSGNTNLSNLPLHMADTGTDNYEQEFTLGLVEKDRQLLREIQVALAKIQDGSYGICEGTGKPIAVPRLEAQPWAKYSIEYARQLEKRMFRRAY